MRNVGLNGKPALLAALQNTVRDFEVRFEVREKVFETELGAVAGRLAGLETAAAGEKERLDRLQQISGLSMLDVERKMEITDEELNNILLTNRFRN